MTDRERKLLGDIRDAADELLSFTRGKTEADYLADRGLRLLVERLFLVIGQAATRLRREAPDTFATVQHLRGAIAFRNFWFTFTMKSTTGLFGASCATTFRCF